jgi:hypothetical protein
MNKKTNRENLLYLSQVVCLYLLTLLIIYFGISFISRP